MLQLHLVVVWALAAVQPLLADLAITGPYILDFDIFSPCDDIGSLSIIFDVLLVDKGNRTVYEGNLTIPFDLDDEKLLTHIEIYRWGSTGGWGSFYNVTQYDIMSYMINNFPNVFEAFYGSMGITGKPAPAGTYYLESFRPMGLKLRNLSFLHYGHYKVLFMQSKDGVDVCCLQFIVDVKEDASMTPADTTNGMPLG